MPWEIPAAGRWKLKPAGCRNCAPDHGLLSGHCGYAVCCRYHAGWLSQKLRALLQRVRISGGEATVLKAVRMKILNSFGFVALVVFAAVLLTSVSLSAPAEREPRPEEFSLIHAYMTPAAQRSEQIFRLHPRRN